MDGVVLVLNQNYEPLNVCNIRRAFRLLFGAKAEVIEYNHAEIRTVREVYRAPSVIRLQHHIRRPRPRVKLTRREIFARDRHTCQYCGREAHDLTLDHVMPRHRGGSHTWENLVAACKPCNHRKGGRTPEEARLRLIRPPVEPRSDIYSLFTPYLADDRNEAWRDYLFLGRNSRFAVAVPETPGAADARLARAVPAPVIALLEHLHAHGHAAYVVGGSLRDALLGREPADWDLATDARPDRIVALFPGLVYENRFGTVAVRRDEDVFEITTFRTEHDYADFRRPHRVEFGDDVEADLARRDFTVNALAWGGKRDGGGNALVDPFGGLADLAACRLRAVGDPGARFREDALRMIRAVRLAATLEFEVEPATLWAIGANAELVRHLSGERVGGELARLLAAPGPSTGLRLAFDTGLLAVISPELAAQRGIAQNKIPGEDLWDHTLRTVDAVPADRPVVRLAALLHDIGKPATLADGRFHHHDIVGAQQAAALLKKLRYPRATAEQVVHLIRHHMFVVDPGATDAAVRRFIRRIGRESIEPLFELRRADDIGSGMPADDPDQLAFRARIEAEIAARVPLDRNALAVDGGDLMRELGLQPGPRLGGVLEALVDQVIADPVLNDRATLMLLAQGMLADMLPDEGEG